VRGLLRVCPDCNGRKVVAKTAPDGTMQFYSDRITVIRGPCERCNGNGYITEKNKSRDRECRTAEECGDNDR